MAIDTTCGNPLNNIVKLEKDKFKLDANGDVCVNVCISEPTGDASKCQYNSGTYETADVGSEECFLSCTVAAGMRLIPDQVIVAFSGTGQFLIKIEGNTIMRLITSPAQPTIAIKLENNKPIEAGETIEICFCGPCENKSRW